MGIYRNNNGVIENLTPTAPPAIGIQYDNTSSELEATNVQDAVDEVVEALDGKQDALTNPLTQSDVVNNLTSTATNVPLSAAQGKGLKEALDGKFPALLYDIEYKTGENFLGKPVYGYLHNYGYVGDNTNIEFDLPQAVSSNIACGVDIKVYANTISNNISVNLRYMGDGSGLSLGSFPTYSNPAKFYFANTAVFGSLVVLFKYTKLTD